jgi:hypothetical protein
MSTVVVRVKIPQSLDVSDSERSLWLVVEVLQSGVENNPEYPLEQLII